jgi:hypothetical protein
VKGSSACSQQKVGKKAAGRVEMLIPFWILDWGFWIGKLRAARVSVCELPRPLFQSVSFIYPREELALSEVEE